VLLVVGEVGAGAVAVAVAAELSQSNTRSNVDVAKPPTFNRE